MATSLLSISTKSSEALDATVKGLQLIDKSLQTQIRRATSKMGTPEWQAEVAEHLAGNDLQSAVLGSSNKVQASNQNVMLSSGASTRRMRGGATPADLAHSEEFGSNRNRVTAYRRRSRKGRTAEVLRHTTHQLMPPSRSGWTVFQAARVIIPRIAQLWVQTTMRTIYEAVEGKVS
ncbi:hypothetical protein [Humibacter ginsenosidimutans]|uniref:HK97 gp10 family phage protein n=1 Tax=Humibacter ginsenosidimutans TaxID=2599293 RepID=A0A5B8M1V8_9MICO|nr:hypothetical protein [Humibacter ginsenosidimutans]QDZ14246.1 hypothetical protein FPZ11_05225 [Humibacter ginsenosidimutans]